MFSDRPMVEKPKSPRQAPGRISGWLKYSIVGTTKKAMPSAPRLGCWAATIANTKFVKNERDREKDKLDFTEKG